MRYSHPKIKEAGSSYARADVDQRRFSFESFLNIVAFFFFGDFDLAHSTALVEP